MLHCLGPQREDGCMEYASVVRLIRQLQCGLMHVNSSAIASLPREEEARTREGSKLGVKMGWSG